MHHREQTLHLAAVALDLGRELRSLRDRHADAVDDDVADLVEPIFARSEVSRI
jgi:hypothetical protein